MPLPTKKPISRGRQELLIREATVDKDHKDEHDPLRDQDDVHGMLPVAAAGRETVDPNQHQVENLPPRDRRRSKREKRKAHIAGDTTMKNTRGITTITMNL